MYKKFGGVLHSHEKDHTIIGAESFHCPVRNGKEWCQLAMSAKQTVELLLEFVLCF